MILVMGHIKLAAGTGMRMRETLAAHAAVCRAEAGCDDYSLAHDAADPDLIRVAERWETPDALAAHGQTEHQRQFGRTLREHGVEQVSVKAWDGAFWRTLVGE